MAFIYDLTDTWNAGGTTFSAIKMNVTDTASAAASKLVQCQISGTDKFTVGKDGGGYFAGNVGIGTSSPSGKLSVYSGSDGSNILDLTGGAAGRHLYVTSFSNSGSAGAGFDFNASSGQGAFSFSTTGTERMRIDSAGNVGIGTSSPTDKLTVDASTTTGISVVRAGSDRVRAFGDGTLAWGATANQGTLTWNTNLAVIQANSGNSLAFNTNGTTERMRITSDGTVAVGTTSPIATARTHLQLNSNANFTGTLQAAVSPTQLVLRDVSNTTTYPNCYTNILFGEGATGAHWQYIAGVRDAGLVFGTATGSTPTERMRIDSSGNVGIGTSSPTNTNGGLDAAGALVARGGISAHQTSAGVFDVSGNDLRIRSYGATAGTGSIAFRTGGGGGSTDTERMRIDSSGRVGIGTTSPSNPLDIEASTATVDINMTNTANRAEINLQESGTTKGIIQYRGSTNGALASTMRIGTQGSDDLIFNTGGAERMRVLGTSGLLVGKTADNTTDDGHVLGDGGYLYTTRNGNICHVLNRRGTEGDIVQYRNDNVTVGSVSIAASSTSYNTSSDYRLKDIDGPIANSGAYIDALKPVQGSWKADGSRFIGLLAHEVQEVSETQIATGEKDGEEMQAMDYSSPELIANLIAEIQSLRARVAQLEG